MSRLHKQCRRLVFPVTSLQAANTGMAAPEDLNPTVTSLAEATRTKVLVASGDELGAYTQSTENKRLEICQEPSRNHICEACA
ncbi:hypothetical protein BaRGS_00004990 [Batillaria attramentaria]|uniref:Secreted protein n=1 Tax=Batillaria attramentaria TaxID=370345 RepID=A0ABD0LWH5_9CAEN